MRQAAIGLAAVLALATGSALAQEGDSRAAPRGDSPEASSTESGTFQPGDTTGTGETVPPGSTVDAEEGYNTEDDDVETDRGDSSILPNAEGHRESEAETMELDCVANPEDCIDPLEQPTTGPTLSRDADPATVQGEHEDPVITEPD